MFPSRYQSDEVDHADGSLVRQCNRKLRGAAMLVAENLIKCHPYYRWRVVSLHVMLHPLNQPVAKA
ncbi:MAG: hypothetical protein ACC628_06880 [Pirellulaceae bacterium]